MKRVWVALLAALPFAALAGELPGVLWLTESAPPKSAKPAEHDHSAHMQHMPAAAASNPSAASSEKSSKHDHDNQIVLDEAPGKDHRPGKQIWLRRGSDIKKSPYVGQDGGDSNFTMIDQSGRKSVMNASDENGLITVKAEMPEIGFYETYLEQRSVNEGKLLVEMPKIELLWASCSAKEVDEDAVSIPIYNETVALELVREHMKDEGCMARIVSGDVVNFQVLSFGKPVAGIPVTLVTQEGWRNTETSDENGKVAFTMIREYYPKWLEFKKYHTDVFLVSAEMVKQEAGVLGGKRYTSAHYVATLPGKYRPSPYDYRSYAWGLGISLFVIVFGGLSIYLYRRRRLKPYKEERVDGKP